MYKLSILGGTFAQFHLGHQKLLDEAFSQSEHVIIGISQPVLYQHKFLAEMVEEYAIREQYVKDYVIEKDWLDKTTFIPIEDIWGNSLEEESIEAVFVTEITYPAAEKINEERKKLNFPLLEIITVPLVPAADGKPLTSERIRAGEIDREGTVYLDLFKTKLTLPDSLRESLRKPMGTVVKTTEEALLLLTNTQFTISVGDIITRSLHEAGFLPSISIIDHKTRRQELASDIDLSKTTVIKTKNEHGTINHEAVHILHSSLQSLSPFISHLSPHSIIVSGEEDLLALPAILFAPLGSVVLYGHYDLGIVLIEVTEQKKQEMKEILLRFV